MVELTLTFDRKPIKTYHLNKDVILIGRDPTCDIAIDNVGVSRHHARIEKQGITYVLSDLASGNGTFVNGKRIQRYNLNDGDEIGLWNYAVIFKSSGPVVATAASAAGETKTPAPPPAPPPKKMDIEATIAIDGRQLELKQRERSSTIRGYLIYQDPKHGERTFNLLKTTTFWGRDTQCDFKIGGWFVMPRHAMIVRDESGFRFINFAKSRRGTVNGQNTQDQRLKDGDVIHIGNISYKYFSGLPPAK